MYVVLPHTHTSYMVLIHYVIWNSAKSQTSWMYFVAGHKSKHNSRLRKKGADLSELQSAIESIKQTQEDINRWERRRISLCHRCDVILRLWALSDDGRCVCARVCVFAGASPCCGVAPWPGWRAAPSSSSATTSSSFSWLSSRFWSTTSSSSSRSPPRDGSPSHTNSEP